MKNMAKFGLKRPNMLYMIGSILLLVITFIFGDQVMQVADNIAGEDGEVNESDFKDAYEMLGVGKTDGVDNSSNGLIGVLGIIGVMNIFTQFIKIKL